MNRVLVVEDDEISSDLIVHALTRAGYPVETAADGRQAMEILRQGRCRLVISDWNMPHVSGIELCRQVRAADWDGYIYLILLTSHSTPNEIVEGLSAGADDFIVKPFNPDELIVRVRAGQRILSLETREMAIFALAKLAESRDPETGHHLERVRCYSSTLAQYLASTPKYRQQIDSDYVRLIYQTSPLHDIGKVAIPDCVLRKPGQLNDAEFAVMKTHALRGAETLDAALERFPEANFLKVARDIAATHHERWDGSGYPAGLAGEDIPLAGRIVAVADVYDALTSRRIYKDAYAHSVARSIILGDAGAHFDPDVVDAFIRTEDEFIAIYNRFCEDTLSRSNAAELVIR
ncbi:MAG: response regulator [Planctomycetes bacterium]|nr:response regulator [Planctomycetota bacterium]